MVGCRAMLEETTASWRRRARRQELDELGDGITGDRGIRAGCPREIIISQFQASLFIP
jgi:hypothetical protein